MLRCTPSTRSCRHPRWSRWGFSFPKAAAIVASIPRPVVGGAGSVGLGLIPLTVPNFYQHVAPGLRILLGGGIAMGAPAAIFLNLVLSWHHHGPEDDPHHEPHRGEPSPL